MSTPQITTYAALVGQSLAWLRQLKGLEQLAVAEHVGVGQPTWSKIERGESALTIEQLARAAALFHTTPAQILQTADAGVQQLHAQGVYVAASRAEPMSPTAAFVTMAALAFLIAGIMRS